MSWTYQINRVAGVALLLLALGIILSIVFDVATTDADPFERDQVEEFLRDINSNEASAILLVVADLATDAAFGIAAAVGLYLIFRDRNRLLGQVEVSCEMGLGPPGVGIDEFLALLAHWGPCP